MMAYKKTIFFENVEFFPVGTSDYGLLGLLYSKMFGVSDSS